MRLDIAQHAPWQDELFEFIRGKRHSLDQRLKPPLDVRLKPPNGMTLDDIMWDTMGERRVQFERVRQGSKARPTGCCPLAA